MIQISREFRDLLKLLNDEQIEYLVIGGYAVIHHGYPRSTLDTDLWFGKSPENLRRCIARYATSDYRSSGADEIIAKGIYNHAIAILLEAN
jgi:hypothetical protein